MKHIHILTTGGTIDKVYQPNDGAMGFDQSIIEKMLDKGRVTVGYRLESLFQKDSLEINEAERLLILEAVESSQSSHILITHGTDTLADTAQMIGDKLLAQKSHKTVVLMGAMIPFRVEESDALFNLGAALLAVQILSAGCYVVMNGQVFNFNNVRKNYQNLTFEVKDTFN